MSDREKTKVTDVRIDLAALAAGAKVVPIGTLVAIAIPIADPLTAVLVRAHVEGWRRA